MFGVGFERGRYCRDKKILLFLFDEYVHTVYWSCRLMFVLKQVHSLRRSSRFYSLAKLGDGNAGPVIEERIPSYNFDEFKRSCAKVIFSSSRSSRRLPSAT